MATTYRQVLNNVLVALSEEEVSDAKSMLTTKYEKLLGLFINQFKEQVEEAHNWRALRTNLSVVLPAATSSVAITGANERSRMLRVYDEIRGEEMALCFDVTDSNNPYRLREMDLSELLRRRALDTSNGNDPKFFAIDNTGQDNVSIQVWPTPPTQRNIDITMIVPQDTLTMLDDNITIPTRPIEVGAIWYALEERGEELGTSGVFNQALFDNSLASAIGRDAAEQGEYQLVPV